MASCTTSVLSEEWRNKTFTVVNVKCVGQEESLSDCVINIVGNQVLDGVKLFTIAKVSCTGIVTYFPRLMIATWLLVLGTIEGCINHGCTVICLTNSVH